MGQPVIFRGGKAGMKLRRLGAETYYCFYFAGFSAQSDCRTRSLKFNYNKTLNAGEVARCVPPPRPGRGLKKRGSAMLRRASSTKAAGAENDLPIRWILQEFPKIDPAP
jgi:hypothetical protein